ncbi:hypothetical protein SAMN04487950_0119 [Halogranum rubrum]|uniref:Uncharacterized protein n=2 Tax=Halogranum rubrum TaxID=553466 RepID=A0A1I4AV36_9EURY|nr:hypothetical protein SAMN04487950_0119 [Halogranum rubrum]
MLPQPIQETMSTRVDTLSETAAVVAASVLLVTVLTAVLGAVLRVTFWGTMHGTGATEYHVFDAPGFELGFGVPVVSVVGWTTLGALVLGGAYFLYRERDVRDARGESVAAGSDDR